MILPILTYCPLITHDMSNSIKTSIGNLESRANRIVSNGELPNIYKIKRNLVCSFVYKIIHNQTCNNFVNYFDIINETHTRNDGFLIRLPKVRLQSAKTSFYFSGAKCYNDLPLEIRKSASLSIFKEHLKLI